MAVPPGLPGCLADHMLSSRDHIPGAGTIFLQPSKERPWPPQALSTTKLVMGRHA